jgi:hypothetical protein
MVRIEINKYNHYKGDPSSRPACLHPRVQSYDLGQCAECNIRLDQERLNKETQLAEWSKKKILPLLLVQPFLRDGDIGSIAFAAGPPLLLLLVVIK